MPARAPARPPGPACPWSACPRRPRSASRGRWPAGAAGCARRRRVRRVRLPRTPVPGTPVAETPGAGPRDSLYGRNTKRGKVRLGRPKEPTEEGPAVSLTETSDRFTTLPDEPTLAATVVALE